MCHTLPACLIFPFLEVAATVEDVVDGPEDNPQGHEHGAHKHSVSHKRRVLVLTARHVRMHILGTSPKQRRESADVVTKRSRIIERGVEVVQTQIHGCFVEFVVEDVESTNKMNVLLRQQHIGNARLILLEYRDDFAEVICTLIDGSVHLVAQHGVSCAHRDLSTLRERSPWRVSHTPKVVWLCLLQGGVPGYAGGADSPHGLQDRPDDAAGRVRGVEGQDLVVAAEVDGERARLRCDGEDGVREGDGLMESVQEEEVLVRQRKHKHREQPSVRVGTNHLLHL
mmetsp:Transcript_20191/g.48130  ORF Transcript_20191/g.48130 Transcript_20191/m.48130 type:complete len:283 (-) Transcript_20191:392-1240(-)